MSKGQRKSMQRFRAKIFRVTRRDYMLHMLGGHHDGRVWESTPCKECRIHWLRSEAAL